MTRVLRKCVAPICFSLALLASTSVLAEVAGAVEFDPERIVELKESVDAALPADQEQGNNAGAPANGAVQAPPPAQNVGGAIFLGKVDFGAPASFVEGNIVVFDEGTKAIKEKFQAKFGGICPPPDDDNDDDDDKKKKDKPEPPNPPPNPPKPKFRPDEAIITPDGDAGGKVAIELIDAEAEVTVNGSGFNPLDVDQVIALSRQNANNDAANNNNAGNNAGGAVISSASSAISPPPATAYFFIDPVTDTVTALPSVVGSNFSAGTDNLTQAFLFPFSAANLIFENPALLNLSAIFNVGTTYVNTVRNTATGDRYRITVTVQVNNVAVTVEKL